MPTTEQAISDLTAQASLLMDLPQSLAATATQQIATITNSYNSRIATLAVTRYVHQVAGDDVNNNGQTLATPYKTLAKALADCPSGGTCDIVLDSDYQITGADIAVNNKSVRIRTSANGTKRSLTFERYESAGYRMLRNFTFSWGGQLFFQECALVMPDDAGMSIYTDLNGAMFYQTSTTRGVNTVSFYMCDISIPANPYTKIFSGGLWGVYAASLGAPVQPLAGRLFRDQANTAGAASNTLPWLVTNIATV